MTTFRNKLIAAAPWVLVGVAFALFCLYMLHVAHAGHAALTFPMFCYLMSSAMLGTCILGTLAAFALETFQGDKA